MPTEYCHSPSGEGHGDQRCCGDACLFIANLADSLSTAVQHQEPPFLAYREEVYVLTRRLQWIALHPGDRRIGTRGM
jgi:hypothetical protein